MVCLEDFDQENVKNSLRELLHHDYGRSVYGSTVSRLTSSRSTVMSIAAKRADAVAELAAKEMEYSMMQEIETRKCELEKLKAEKDIKAAKARLQAYDQEMAQEVSIHSSDLNRWEQQDLSISAAKYDLPRRNQLLMYWGALIQMTHTRSLSLASFTVPVWEREHEQGRRGFLHRRPVSESGWVRLSMKAGCLCECSFSDTYTAIHSNLPKRIEPLILVRGADSHV